jgi:hypothetical protein
MSITEALGGRWATHWGLWAALFVPTLLLVILRESVTGYPTWWWPVVSGMLQHLAVGAIVLGGGALARRRSEVLPIAVVSVLWLTAAVARAAVGAALASSIAGADPEFLLRSAFWLLGTLVWVPVVVYTAAQLDRRRLLLGALDETSSTIEQQRSAADASEQEVRQSLSTAVRASLQPALGELVASLESSRDRLSSASIAELSMRVSDLHDRTADLLEPPPAVAPRTVVQRSTLRRAFDVPPRRPWLIAMLAVISSTVALVPDVWRVFGGLAALELVVSIAAAGVLIGFIPWAAIVTNPERATARSQGITVLACVAGIALAIYLILNSGIDPLTQNGVAVLPLVVVALSVSCLVHVGAIVLEDANREASNQLHLRTQQSDRERSLHNDLVDRERRRLADLMHGPVQGRLAACVMALNFTATSAHSANGDNGDNGTVDTTLVDSVLDHLRAVSRDLSSIASHATPPPS